MQSFIWAIGSGLLLLLVLNFIPIGLTFKGKLSVALIGFVLALAGLVVDTSIPLWQTGLIILLLVLISAYIMDTRFGSLIYISESDLLELQVEENFEYDVFNQSTEKHLEMELLDLEAEPEPEVLPTLHLEETQMMPFSEESQNEVENKEIDNDDLLFLDDTIEPDDRDEDIVKENETGEGYLSDIESLLFEELELTNSNYEGRLQVMEDLEYDVFNQSTEKHLEMELLNQDEQESEVLPILHLEETQIMPFPEQSQNEVEIGNKEIDNDDLLFLDDTIEPDNKDEDIVEETGEGYLSDIEGLLFEELEVTDSNDESHLQDINVFETENKVTDSVISEEDNNSLNELFLAIEEAAAAKNAESKKESDPEREFKLQK
ncbi:hypothetical protein L1999_22530 [Neobacillus drentensis]|uniref:hypothetical protein n=1 Tax=Neobacillus drentensis TaxID=220684 RepID=UPI001F1AE738|nr:hypothetical protein [Neobacillus drentensis]ULT55839.1 hypothetical protein L1999_22530 [Neobacillus drentensis]